MNGELLREPSPPREPLTRLFLRFLKFGALAWGGPVAQIAMIRQELVEEERWISRERFNRILALYQVLPGPEAHELCVYFGMIARGRVGGMLAGLGFMLPGFILMFLLSILYVAGLRSPVLMAAFLGIQPAVVGLVVRAVGRIGHSVLTNRTLWGVAVAAAGAELVGTSFWITLPLSGLIYLFVARRRHLAAAAAMAALGAGVLIASDLPAGLWSQGGSESPAMTVQAPRPDEPGPAGTLADGPPAPRPSLLRLFWSGLRSGLLTFGGAYTVIPFLRNDAVLSGRWMTNGEFLDGLALSGILPAPLIIFSTFVGYLGGGPLGALVLTVGIFLPAFGFTLLAHDPLERLVENRTVHTFLDGVTAGVVGLIAATAIALFRAGIRDAATFAIFGIALVVLYRWRAKAAVAAVVLGAAGAGLVLLR